MLRSLTEQVKLDIYNTEESDKEYGNMISENFRKSRMVFPKEVNSSRKDEE